jgi:citrate lyase gamma subunit
LRLIASSLIAWLVVSLASCSAPKEPDAGALEAAAAARIQAIPAAQPEMYKNMRDMRAWRNPYLIVRKDGIGMLDVGNNEQRLLKPEELLPALAELPSSAWPYGRVVAVTENGIGAPGDDVPIRRNRALVAGTLESVHVLINWVPAT